MELTDYTICELMGLTELPLAQQKACTEKLEETVSGVLLADSLNPSLPPEELDILMETLHRDELHDTWSGKIPMNRLPVLRGNITRRLEWLVAAMIREEIKYLIEICEDDEFAQKLLWKIRAQLSSANWHDVVLSMGYLAAKHVIPQKDSIFELCFDNAMERYHKKYKDAPKTVFP